MYIPGAVQGPQLTSASAGRPGQMAPKALPATPPAIIARTLRRGSGLASIRETLSNQWSIGPLLARRRGRLDQRQDLISTLRHVFGDHPILVDQECDRRGE